MAVSPFFVRFSSLRNQPAFAPAGLTEECSAVTIGTDFQAYDCVYTVATEEYRPIKGYPRVDGKHFNMSYLPGNVTGPDTVRRIIRLSGKAPD